MFRPFEHQRFEALDDRQRVADGELGVEFQFDQIEPETGQSATLRDERIMGGKVRQRLARPQASSLPGEVMGLAGIRQERGACLADEVLTPPQVDLVVVDDQDVAGWVRSDGTGVSPEGGSELRDVSLE